MHLHNETLQVAEQERNWLLNEISPNALCKLKHHLEKCYTLLSATSKTDALPLSTTQNEAIKGYISLGGCHINKAEIQVKLPNHHSEAIKATIASSTPYFLEQAQQCKNYLIMANKLVQDCYDSLSKQKAVALFDAVSKLIDRALHAFDYPNESMLFPEKVCHPNSFSPPLKQDLVVEFCINNVYIVCNVFAIDSNNLSASRTIKLNIDRQQHHHVTYKDKLTEILDEARTQTQSPMLTDLKTNLTSIRDICQTHKRMLLQVQA
ncbi:RAVE subunit 2/Rogdi [Absidia repens]|uniref:RAVE subunit 2/Rogdi n=1 Tax=Absidia repens TaxID=90262 RepID=A0A1X2IVX9_9FUNG|nr:RAVE subunit 2/Rogdi [Absidia repens]